ncbi:hypothetical protein AVEN_216530-1 [Araneus ventricosus]|uniref:Endonuclease/exonuclease/phosphatase domain-containing protein n=1 Tax=Araneus ventricosus TaxID=182803 RepID=A0A4Y2EY80_ARAVE|nr:hypothetical protein AVEN_216530-1 [Araneus ventricosus]
MQPLSVVAEVAHCWCCRMLWRQECAYSVDNWAVASRCTPSSYAPALCLWLPNNITSVPGLSSDHNPVILNFFFNYNTPKPDKAFKTNWTKFSNDLSNYPIIDINTNNDLDTQINHLTDEIINAFHNNSKEVNPNIANSNSELRNIFTLCNKTKRDWQATRSPALRRKL